MASGTGGRMGRRSVCTVITGEMLLRQELFQALEQSVVATSKIRITGWRVKHLPALSCCSVSAVVACKSPHEGKRCLGATQCKQDESHTSCYDSHLLQQLKRLLAWQHFSRDNEMQTAGSALRRLEFLRHRYTEIALTV
ncbi:hypothetical protein AVEN_125824-1 [Araneus ventricosus]|uniref:Uncharacterized protein n=1 Tax=Araneus ventricosus TaxID=182803 RepID=A0A4Y1ZRU4_ARAVE|nr:hypothetical protein AVEN_125824-1 [Araneus ventricosus]